VSSNPAVRPLRTRLLFRLLTGVAMVALTAGAALAQTAEPEEDNEVEEVVVNGVRKLPGQVIGDITPEIILSPREIRAYGVSNVAELLDALSPQTTSGQGGGGRPVTLINGGRVSGFAEIRDLPTEAISRVDILPEEVALKYGYPAEQKVVNIVLRQRFRARLAEATVTAPTQGEGESIGGHASYLRIQQGQRMTLDAKATQSASILESDRNVVGGAGAFRTLQPRSNDIVLNAVMARPLGGGVSGTINGVYEATESDARLGLSSVTGRALVRHSEADDGRIAAAASGALAGWQWSYTGEVAKNVSTSKTERALTGIAYTDRTRAETTSAQSDIVLNRALLRLPAGQLSTNLTARVSTLELESEALRAGVLSATDLTRTIGQLQANLDAPLTRVGDGIGIGKLTANFNVNHQHLSDFGDLESIGYGLNWTPVSPVRVLASFTRTDQAPTINQLGDPVVATPGARVFDLTRGETAEVVRISGGLRNLDGGRRDLFKLGVTYKPFTATDLTFQANYVSTRTRDAIVAFPSASTQVEAAFPDRFIRDASGVLTQIDARPVNFSRQSRDELRWGFTYSRPVGRQPTPDQLAAMRRGREEGRAQAQAQAAPTPSPTAGDPAAGAAQNAAGATPGAPPPGDARPPGAPAPSNDGPPRYFGGPGDGRGPGRAGGPGGRGGFGGFGGGPRGGVFQVGLYHTVAFRDEVLIRPGLAALDLLDGGAIGAGGGSPRHQINLQTNYTKGGLGLAMNAKWESATRLNGGAFGDDLKFSDQTTVNLRLFADLGMQPMARNQTWLRGARATVSIDNLFDSRQRVTTAAGVTPISYQPDLLDPVGRTVRVTLRKMFF